MTDPKQTDTMQTIQTRPMEAMVFTRLYLRASSEDQNALRAKDALLAFAKERGLTVAATYVENESGTRLDRPELFRLLNDSSPGDLLLIEQVDRLSRLNASDWEMLKATITAKQVRIVALDLPTSHAMATTERDSFTSRVLDAVNGMLLDMLAAVARKDYVDRRRRQAEGIARAKLGGQYRGRAENVKRNAGIVDLLVAGKTWSYIMATTGCSKATLAKLSKRLRSQAS